MTSSEIDPYEILQVPHNATDREIKVAYKKLALLNHPDRSKTIDETKMAIINEAYAILKDPERRRRYDLTQSDFNMRNRGTTRSGRVHTSRSSRTFRDDFDVRPFASDRMSHNMRGRGRDSGMFHSVNDPFPPGTFMGAGGISNRDTGNNSFTFSFISTKQNVDASGKSKIVRKTTRCINGKKETCIHTVTVNPDGTHESETKITNEDAMPFMECNPLDNLLPQLKSIGDSVKKWIKGGNDGTSVQR